MLFLDYNFRNPDIDRFEQYDPSVAVLGDSYNHREAAEYQAVISDLQDNHPYKTYVVVPKCQKAFDLFDIPSLLHVRTESLRRLIPGFSYRCIDWAQTNS